MFIIFVLKGVGTIIKIETLVNLIHYANHLWHLAKDIKDTSKNYFKQRKIDLQKLLRDNYAEEIELILDEEQTEIMQENVYIIYIKKTGKNACHIPENEL